MLKTLHRNDTQIIPYTSTKDWNLSNVDNTDLVVSEAGNSISYEHVIFTPNEVFPENDICNVAKENQSLDLVLFREGKKIDGLFYPNLDPLNIDGTYKRMVYTQIKTAFYNNYRDPTKIWGMEKIDFDSSNTKKFLSDSIKILDIPTRIMGEKIVEGTLKISDNSIDDIHLITDDGQNNLFAGSNLFSRIQEIGYFQNVFSSGSNSICDTYFDFEIPKSPYNLTSSQVGAPPTVSLNWLDAPADGFVIEKSIYTGSEFSPFYTFMFVSANETQSYDTDVYIGGIYSYRVYSFNNWGSSSYTNTSSIEIL